tara:strand:- start:202 stop:423 length:222 start_codon:yes stop_codon:yes gene_type:complete
MSKYNDLTLIDKFKSWRYSILYVATFVVMLMYFYAFDNTPEVSNSDSFMVSIPYIIIGAIAAAVHWKKLLGTK